MTGIEFILTSLCVNITCDIIRSEKSPIQANYWINNCLSNETCENFSLPEPTNVVFNIVENNYTSSLAQKGFFNIISVI